MHLFFLIISIETFSVLLYVIVERMFYDQPYKLGLIFHLKSIYGHLVLHFFSVQLVWNIFFQEYSVCSFLFLLGELPFQPYAGTRKDRAVMKKILDSKKTGCISGMKYFFVDEIDFVISIK